MVDRQVIETYASFLARKTRDPSPGPYKIVPLLHSLGSSCRYASFFRLSDTDIFHSLGDTESFGVAGGN